MIKVTLAVFDEKSGIYSDPFNSLTTETAIRDFTYAVTQEQNSQLYRYPMDFHLFQIATYDDQNGTYTPHRQLLTSGSQLIHLQNKTNPVVTTEEA